jgi:hypothetical protein
MEFLDSAIQKPVSAEADRICGPPPPVTTAHLPPIDHTLPFLRRHPANGRPDGTDHVRPFPGISCLGTLESSELLRGGAAPPALAGFSRAAR